MSSSFEKYNFSLVHNARGLLIIGSDLLVFLTAAIFDISSIETITNVGGASGILKVVVIFSHSIKLKISDSTIATSSYKQPANI